MTHESSSKRRPIARRACVLSLALFSVELVGCASFRGNTEPDAIRSAVEHQKLMETARLADDAFTPASFDELMLQADGLRDQGRVADAALTYIRALGLSPDSTLPRERLGFMHLEENPAHALTIFEGLLDRDSSSAEAYTGLGLAQLSRGELERAQDSLERALSFGATSVVPSTALGVIHDRFGEFETAQLYYRSALEIEPLSAQLNNNLGTSQMLAGDFEAAAESFHEALRRAPQDKALLNNLGLALGRLERYEDARRAFDRADPDATANNLGYVHFVNGDFKKALVQYEIALIAAKGDRLTLLRNLHAAQEALYGTYTEARVVDVRPEPKPRSLTPTTDLQWLQ